MQKPLSALLALGSWPFVALLGTMTAIGLGLGAGSAARYRVVLLRREANANIGALPYGASVRWLEPLVRGQRPKVSWYLVSTTGGRTLSACTDSMDLLSDSTLTLGVIAFTIAGQAPSGPACPRIRSAWVVSTPFPEMPPTQDSLLLVRFRDLGGFAVVDTAFRVIYSSRSTADILNALRVLDLFPRPVQQ